jgi:copper chaperone NosL
MTTLTAGAVPFAGTAPSGASRRGRVLLALAAVLLGLSIVFPLWRVTLTAPQYPEGLGLHIWAHTVQGVEPSDLQNINGLNHYIGMDTIEPDSIPELRVMRPGIIGMAVLGLLIALSGRRRLLIAWSVALVVAALVGMADFYKWEYDYGHNLDLEHAPIKIPGMSYQPPLIGSKKLLNFTATSWPATGGVLAIAAVVLGVGAAVGSAGAAAAREQR